MKTLEIKRFLILNAITVEYTDLLVIIGPQAQGKSLVSKLLYFFEGLEKDVFSNVINNGTKLQLQSKLRDKFLQIFNMDNLQNKDIDIKFTCEKFICSINKKANNSKINIDFDEEFYSNLKSLKHVFRRCKKIKDDFSFPSFYELIGEEQHDRVDFESIVNSFSKYLVTKRSKDSEPVDFETIKAKLNKALEFDKLYMNQERSVYVPAGRSFFANLQKSIFNFLTNNLPIDFFLKEFGARYERMKYGCTENQDEFFYTAKGKSNFENTCLTILGGNYIRLKDRDFIKSKDGALVNLEFASSGQQEALPMLLSVASTSKNNTLIIEEPEAHLFPSAQAEVIKLIGKTYNLNQELSNFIITTHSPYILMSINNAIQAYIAKYENFEIKSSSAKEWIDAAINTSNVAAYILINGKIKSIIDEETGLINADEIDLISSKLSSDFEELLG
ncbi:AAA family ATPase [Acinetobacter radioresistens]|uniref:ATP-binding protein n=2 Tax=Acinetobacter radioresistens TaxID=40216 RepID=A0A8H2K193_ACIRA|nr:AAA family ATPase [Acinetobacter radioresistens]TNX86342.1 ATP-binding protein [Acinetobacter radioresistens]